MSRIGLRPIHEQQAALNLGLLANSPTDFGNLDQVPQVIAQLLVSSTVSNLHVNLSDVSTNFVSNRPKLRMMWSD